MSKKEVEGLQKIKKETLEKKSLNFEFKYWSPEIHFASAVLPKYISNELK
jgi:spermidine synthase